MPLSEWKRVGERFLVPGMRTPLSYLVKPLTDHLARTFWEE